MLRRTLGLLLIAAAVSVQAQKHQEQITVNVVEVPVYVERFGVPVSGLSRDDFELYVNGARQTIDYFDVLDERAPDVEGEQAPPPLNRRRLFVLLFDQGNVSPNGLSRAQKSAAQWVAEAPGGDAFAVATIRRGGIQFAMPFSTDRVAIQRAIGTLRTSAARDPFSLATLDVERRAWSPAPGLEAASPVFGDLWGGSTPPPGAVARDFQNALATAARFESAELAMHSRRLVDSLGDLADRLGPISGIKHVVILAGGELGQDGDLTFMRDILRMHRRFRAAGVVLDAVDVSGSKAVWPGASGSIPNLGAPRSFYSLVLDTGGAVASSLAGLQQRNSVAYVLGFQPHDPQKKQNRIRVRLKDRRFLTDVRYRKSYSIAPESASANGLFLADALLNDIPQNGVTLDLDVNVDRANVVVAAIMPGNELLALGSDEPLLLDVFQYVFNERNLIAEWNHARVSLDLARGRDFLSAHAYTLRKEFTLQPGRYAAKVLVRVAGRDVTGFRRANFVVTAP